MAFLKSIQQALHKTSDLISAHLPFFQHKTKLDEETEAELSDLLLKADVGIETTEKLLKRVEIALKKGEGNIVNALKKELQLILESSARPFTINPSSATYVMLFVGVNGAGKTSSIGKLAAQLKKQGHSPLLAAGDTFRAAAVQQLRIWSERTHLPLIAGQAHADSASVIFDALQAAHARKNDILLADTAGRLHNKIDLMNELKKLARVLQKKDPEAPHEVILVLDAGIGQNAIQQVRDFNAAIPLTGLILTKLDGTAKGGIIFGLSEIFKLPIYFIGTGEEINDLLPFNPNTFIDTLFQGS